VRGLREAPGRAAAWQRALDAAAARRGLSLQWCMATPADFAESVHLGQIGSIRTSGDYRYLFDNALNWVWFLHGNALARALGLWPYKDVFLSHDKTPEGFGDPLAEAESLLAALSAGPVGIGDQLGHTRRELVLRTCRADGVLVKPDLPLAALDRCVLENGYFGAAPLLGEAVSRHPAGRFVYLVSMNASHASKQSGEPLRFRLGFEELGAARPEGPVALYDWRRGGFELRPADGGFERRSPIRTSATACSVRSSRAKWPCSGTCRSTRRWATAASPAHAPRRAAVLRRARRAGRSVDVELRGARAWRAHAAAVPGAAPRSRLQARGQALARPRSLGVSGRSGSPVVG
jgi:hypothetical protein